MTTDKIGTTSVNSGPVITLSLHEYKIMEEKIKKLEIREEMYKDWICRIIRNDRELQQYLQTFLKGLV